MLLDPIALDQTLSRIADDVYDWEGALREAPEEAIDPFPLHRSKLTRTHFRELCELPEDDPLRLSFLRWTYALMERRINAAWLTRAATQRHADLHPVAGGGNGKATLHDMVTNLLSSPPQRAAWWKVLSQHGAGLSQTEATLWLRRQAIARELDLESPDEFELPNSDVVELARAALDECLPLLEEYSGSIEAWLESSLGQDKASAFPARLNEAQLSDWFREERLLEDLRLRSWTLPQRLGPASFLRALDELGREFCHAAAPTTQPFVIAHDPYRLSDWSHGACFASLLLNPSFVERHLQLPPKNQRETLRGLAVAALLEWARRALKVCLRPVALRSAAQTTEAYRDGMHHAFGLEVAGELTHVVLPLSPADPQAFAGMALGFSRAQELTEQHDDDWFRNPRAVEQLRSEAQIPPATQVDAETLKSAHAALRQSLAALL